MKTFVIGDIHGGYKALVQCLERSKFDKEVDTLITLGDIVDGWEGSYDCVQELLTIKNRIDIKGNHDDWFNVWLTQGYHPIHWMHGGHTTNISYSKAIGIDLGRTITSIDIPTDHKEFFKNQRLYYKDAKNNVFVHGGFNRNMYLDQLEAFYPSDFYWDRDLWNTALSTSKNQKLKFTEEINKVFIGHTATINWRKNGKPIDYPMFKGGIWNLDTGGGWLGKLTIMNVDTEEYWQSDNVQDLYPDERGRM